MKINEYLDQYLQKYLEYRSGAGYATQTYSVTLRPFIDFCKDNFPDAEWISKDMVDGWLKYKSYKANSQISFIASLRQFCRYINFLGQKAYIPDEDYSVKKDYFEPYLMSDHELESLFDAIDTLGPVKRHGRIYENGIIAPVIFRMMYCCGMRPAEPLHLWRSDVDLATGDIYIRETKHYKDRHIIMSEDLLLLCRKYDSLVARERKWFFDKDGECFHTKWMTKLFQRTWRNAGLGKSGVIPRPYDLRHMFATRNIIRWMDEGKDINSLMPFLSTYMGHASLNATFYYIHLIPEKLRNAAGLDKTWSSDIVEECHED